MRWRPMLIMRETLVSEGLVVRVSILQNFAHCQTSSILTRWMSQTVDAFVMCPLHFAGPYMAERYITRDNPAWVAAAADLQSQVAAGRVASVAGVRRLETSPSAAEPDGRSQSVQGQVTAGMQRQQGQKCEQYQQQTHHQQRQRADVLVAAQQAGQPHAQQGTLQRNAGSQQRRSLTALPAGKAAGSGKQLELSEADRRAAALWGRVEQALLAAGPHAVQPPGVRTHETDFVRLGKRMDR